MCISVLTGSGCLPSGIRANDLRGMPVTTRMESRVEGLSSTVSGVQNQLDDHGILLKSHVVNLQAMKEILDRLIQGQDWLSATHERLSVA